MYRNKWLFGLVLFLGMVILWVGHGWTLSVQVRELLRQRIESAGYPPQLSVDDEIIYSSVVLPDFYRNRMFRPAWSDDTEPLAVAEDLVTAIERANLEGHFPEDYHSKKIQEMSARIQDEQRRGNAFDPLSLVDLDLLLTDAFLVYASHLFGGRVDPETFDPEWHPGKRDADFAGILEKALNENRIREALDSLLPAHPEYFRLKGALVRYRKIASEGGWPDVSQGTSIGKGERGERVSSLRRQLVLGGDLKSYAPEQEDYFDDTLTEAVKRFQGRHGLQVDGVVGRHTLAELNVPVEYRIEQVLINLERWRWLPQSLGERYILVNIPNFELEVVENNRAVITMRTIVGRQCRRTPVFTGSMTYLVFSPFWNIPPGIATKDILPQIKTDMGYLERNKIRVFHGWGANPVEIDSETVNWSEITPKNLPYRFRQDPGPDNSLGRVKFMFPNGFSVYLHDTPIRELFLRPVRDFSSGCIRVERPVDLAEYLLADRPAWGREEIEEAMDRNFEHTVTITNPIPVYLMYWTAWAADDDRIHFRRDIYNRDQRVSRALQLPSPARNLRKEGKAQVL